MRPTAGILYEYIDRSGKCQKAVMYYKDQPEAISKADKALLCLLNDDLTQKYDNEKAVIVLKSKRELKNIGFID